MKLILHALHDIIFMDYLFMNVDINFIAFIEMYYYHYNGYPAALENMLRWVESCADIFVWGVA